MSELRFDGRAVVVTGAGRGVGRCHALHLAAKGARVVVADYGVDINGEGSSSAPADDVVGAIKKSGGEAVACRASVADERSASSIVETAIDALGRIDAVINNAGIHDPGMFEDLTVKQSRSMFDVHYFGTLFVTNAAWPHFVEAGYGRVVNTVSKAMLCGIAELTSYGSAKAAVFGLTRNLATEGPPHGIRVNAIAPRAHTRTSASHSDALADFMSMSKQMMDQINASMPPEMFTPAAEFLAHESCSLKRGNTSSRHGWGVPDRCGADTRNREIASHGGRHRRQPRHDLGSQQGDDKECFVSDFDSVGYFSDQSLIPNPYPYFDHLRSKCPVSRESPYGVMAVTGHKEACTV